MWSEGGGTMFIQISTPVSGGGQPRKVMINLHHIVSIAAPSGLVHDHGGVHLQTGIFYPFTSDSGYDELLAALRKTL